MTDFMGKGLHPLLSWFSHNPTVKGTVKFCTPNSIPASEEGKQHPREEVKEAEERRPPPPRPGVFHLAR